MAFWGGQHKARDIGREKGREGWANNKSNWLNHKVNASLVSRNIILLVL